uniref:Uncharacterized protein n=1 Tax=Quercus lobata TaxID=97700 RepID=A0A7N2KZN8_QUELO
MLILRLEKRITQNKAFWVALFTNPGAFIISVMKRQSIEMEDRERQRMERAERAEKEGCSEAAAEKHGWRMTLSPLWIQCRGSGHFATQPFPYASFSSIGPWIVTHYTSTHWSETPFCVAVACCKSSISPYILMIIKDLSSCPVVYTFCSALVVLKLNGHILLNPPFDSKFPSLKILQLEFVNYANYDSLATLLAVCPILQHFSLNVIASDLTILDIKAGKSSGMLIMIMIFPCFIICLP